MIKFSSIVHFFTSVLNKSVQWKWWNPIVLVRCHCKRLHSNWTEFRLHNIWRTIQQIKWNGCSRFIWKCLKTSSRMAIESVSSLTEHSNLSRIGWMRENNTCNNGNEWKKNRETNKCFCQCVQLNMAIKNVNRSTVDSVTRWSHSLDYASPRNIQLHLRQTQRKFVSFV